MPKLLTASKRNLQAPPSPTSTLPSSTDKVCCTVSLSTLGGLALAVPAGCLLTDTEALKVGEAKRDGSPSTPSTPLILELQTDSMVQSMGNAGSCGPA